MRCLLLTLTLFILACEGGGDAAPDGSGGGAGSVNINLDCSQISDPQVLAREGCNIVLNQTNPTDESSVGEIENNQLTLEELVFLDSIDPEGNLTLFEEECAKCCDPATRLELSEGSCVAIVEDRFNEDCPEEVLVDIAQCSADLSQ